MFSNLLSNSTTFLDLVFLLSGDISNLTLKKERVTEDCMCQLESN